MASPTTTSEPRIKRKRSASREHDTDAAALSPRQARSPYATSDLRGSPSIDPTASPSLRPHSLRSSSNAAGSGGAGRYLAHHHAHSSGAYTGLGASRPYTASSARNDDAPSPSTQHFYRSRSPTQHSSSSAASSSAKTARALAALDSSHLSDLQSDLASITSPHQRAASSSTPHTPATADRKMDADDAVGVKREHASTPGEKPRGGQACLECRLAKVRCLPADDSDDCQRCRRFNFECLFVQHKRGRKPKSKLQGRDLTLLAEAAYATNASPVPERAGARKSSAARAADSPGVRWSSASDSAFAAPPLDREPGMDVDDERAPSPSFATKQPLSAFAAHTDARAALDPKNLFGVDVTRMTQAMQQAMRSLERRRGAPYTLVTNNEIVDAADDDASEAATPPAPGTTAAADTNAVNESFELIAEQPLTLRVMLKPFEVSDRPDCETPRVLADDRTALAAQPTPQINDPITQGTLTEPAARALFDLFMHHCNAWSGVFDPSLHTHDFVRKRSSFLYTVLLYVGARYSRRPAAHHLIVRESRGEAVPDSAWDVAFEAAHADRTPRAAEQYARSIRRRIHDQARQHAARAFVDGDRTVLCCQAFFILASWKPLDDGLSVIQVGYAFRLAMDIQLHAEMPNCVRPSDPLPDATARQRYEAVQRRFRNRQRTFLMLFVQDKSQQISNKITTHSISSDNVLIRRCQTWWKHDGSIETDAFVCASADMRRIQGKYVELYDRIEALTRGAAATGSDGPSVMMPAFLSDLYEWGARWYEALHLREDDDDADAQPGSVAYEKRCQRLSLSLWKNNIKTYISSLVLKSSLKQAALLSHAEAVRAHHRRSTPHSSSSVRSVSDTASVNLMSMPAFWPCIEGARGVLEVVCALPPERLLSAPDATITSTTHAAVLLCSLATVKSQPELGVGYLRSTIELVDRASRAFRRASISEDDTVLAIAVYLESLLRPKDATCQGRDVERSGDGDEREGVQARVGNGVGAGGAGGGGVGANTTAQPQEGGPANVESNLTGLTQFTNFTLLAQNQNDMFYSHPPTAQPRFATTSIAPQEPALLFNAFDRQVGLDAIATAAASSHGGGMDWTATIANGDTAVNNAPPWNSLMFNPGYQPQPQPQLLQQQQPAPQTNTREQADETLRMLLRFLDG